MSCLRFWKTSFIFVKMSIKEYWKACVRSVRSFTTKAIYGHLSGANLNIYNAHCSSDPFNDCSCILPMFWVKQFSCFSLVAISGNPFAAVNCSSFQTQLSKLKGFNKSFELFLSQYATIQPDFIEQLPFPILFFALNRRHPWNSQECL